MFIWRSTYSRSKKQTRLCTASVGAGNEIPERRLAERIGELRVIHCPRELDRADHGGHGHECALVRIRLSPIGQLPRDEIHHLLDVARGGLPNLARLPRHLGGEGGYRAAILRAVDVR